MKVLVLGGTRFLGRHLVAECLVRGDDVTVLYRGRSPSPFAGLIRHIVADRRAPTAEATSVLAEPWDAVFDTSAKDVDYLFPIAPHLGAIGQYMFISSCGVYRRTSKRPVITERSPTIFADPIDPVRATATRKLRCERYLRRRLGRTDIRLLIVRLGLVVGTYDYSQRMAYWLEHAIRGGDTLVPMQPDQPIQLIDAHDAARFLLQATDQRLSGVVNVAGPRTTAQILLDTIMSRARQPTRLCWVGEDFALARGLRPWTEIPLWLPASNPERTLMAVDSSRAEATGLSYRPLAETADDCLAWHALQRSWSQQWLDRTREQHLVQQWRG